MHESNNAPHSNASWTAPSLNQTSYPDTSPTDSYETPLWQDKECLLNKIKEALHLKR